VPVGRWRDVREGRVRIVVASARRLVRIEGLGVSRV